MKTQSCKYLVLIITVLFFTCKKEEKHKVPEKPSFLSANSESSSRINLTWIDNSDNETGFKIERSDDAASEWIEIASPGKDITFYQDNGLKTNTTYYYRVYAYNLSGQSEFSNISNSTTWGEEMPVSVPNPPTNLIVISLSSTQIDLAWEDNAHNETGFKVERSPDGISDWMIITILDANQSVYENTGLNTSTTYYYRVCAFNTTGNSTYSNIVNATTSSSSPVPSAPTNLQANSTSMTQIDLSWTDNSDNETGFKIERSVNGISGWTEIASLGANLTTYQNTGLSTSSTYYYRVCAYNAFGNSAYSNISNAITGISTPSAPSNLTVTASSSTQIDLSWADNSNNETGFKVERSLNGTSGWMEIVSLNSNMTSYQNTGLTASTRYYYRVCAYNSGGNSGYSNTVNAITSGTLPVLSTSPVTSVATSSATVGGNITNTGMPAYTERGVCYSSTSSEPTIYHTKVIISGSGTGNFSTSITGLTSNTTYYIRSYATNVSGTAYGNMVSFKTSVQQTVPNTPTNLNANATDPKTVVLTWNDNSNNETGFEIQREHLSNTNQWVTVTTLPANTNSYTHNNLNETWPGYRVRALNNAGNSSYSNTALAPSKLRIVNDLYNVNRNNTNGSSWNWESWNKIIRVRISPENIDIENSNDTYERLTKGEYSHGSVGMAISPCYNNTPGGSHYKDFPVNTYGYGARYKVLLQCGWWEYTGGGSTSWKKHFTSVLTTQGLCCTAKHNIILVSNHTSGYHIIKASDHLPHGTWNNKLSF